jgi:hypothetical protein
MRKLSLEHASVNRELIAGPLEVAERGREIFVPGDQSVIADDIRERAAELVLQSIAEIDRRAVRSLPNAPQPHAPSTSVRGRARALRREA